jgi:hypothetical protein
MAAPAPHTDFDNVPAPDEGILVTLFITVRKVARSRDFYSRVLAAPSPDENPHARVQPRIIMNPGGPPTPTSRTSRSITSRDTTSMFANLCS